MPKHSRNEDPNLFAKNVLDNIIAKYDPDSIPSVVPDFAGQEPEDSGKNPAAVALGKLGGRKGGLARAASMSPKKRSQAARKAAKARWAKKS